MSDATRTPCYRSRRLHPLKQTTILASSLVAIAMLGAACSSGSASSSDGTSKVQAPYVVGMTSSITGPYGFVGTGLKQGATAYFNQLNASGGVDGHKIKFIALDDQLSTSIGVSNAQQLIESDHAIGLIGEDLSATNQEMIPLLQRNSVVSFPEGLEANLVTTSTKVIFGAEATETSMAASLIQFSKTLTSKFPKPLKIAILTSNTLGTIEANNMATQAAKSAGFSVVLNKEIDVTDQDWTSFAQLVKTSGADIVVTEADDPQEQTLIKAEQGLGVADPYVVNYFGGSDYPILQTIQDPNLYVVRSFAYQNSPAAAVQGFAKAVKAAGFNPSAPDVVNGYVEALLISKGLEKCGGSCTPAKLLATMGAIGGIQTGGLTTGPIVYDSTEHAGFLKAQAYHWVTAGKTVEPIGPVLQLG